MRPLLDTQSHDGVDNIVVVFQQRLDGLFTANTGLGHDQLNVLILEPFGVDFLAIVVVVVLLGLGGLDGLAGLTVVVAGVVTVGTCGSKLLSSSLLGRGVDILDLGLAKDTDFVQSAHATACPGTLQGTNM